MDKDRFFITDYEIYGKHADYVRLLTGILVDNDVFRKQIKVFESNVSVLVNAPIIGYLYNRKAKKDINSSITPAKIAGTQMIGNAEEMKYIMRLILLLDDNHEPLLDKRIEKVFKFFGEEESDFILFEEYARGGIEILYEKILGNSTDPFDIADNLMTFISDFEDMFNRQIKENDIIRLCNEFEGKQK